MNPLQVPPPAPAIRPPYFDFQPKPIGLQGGPTWQPLVPRTSNAPVHNLMPPGGPALLGPPIPAGAPPNPGPISPPVFQNQDFFGFNPAKNPGPPNPGIEPVSGIAGTPTATFDQAKVTQPKAWLPQQPVGSPSPHHWFNGPANMMALMQRRNSGQGWGPQRQGLWRG